MYHGMWGEAEGNLKSQFPPSYVIQVMHLGCQAWQELLSHFVKTVGTCNLKAEGFPEAHRLWSIVWGGCNRGYSSGWVWQRCFPPRLSGSGSRELSQTWQSYSIPEPPQETHSTGEAPYPKVPTIFQNSTPAGDHVFRCTRLWEIFHVWVMTDPKEVRLWDLYYLMLPDSLGTSYIWIWNNTCFLLPLRPSSESLNLEVYRLKIILFQPIFHSSLIFFC